MTPTDAVRISHALAEARDANRRAAKLLKSFPGIGSVDRKRHAKELAGAADLIQAWIDQGEPDGYGQGILV